MKGILIAILLAATSNVFAAGEFFIEANIGYNLTIVEHDAVVLADAKSYILHHDPVNGNWLEEFDYGTVAKVPYAESPWTTHWVGEVRAGFIFKSVLWGADLVTQAQHMSSVESSQDVGLNVVSAGIRKSWSF